MWELTLRWCCFAIIVNDGGAVPHTKTNITNIPDSKTNITNVPLVPLNYTHGCPLSPIWYPQGTILDYNYFCQKRGHFWIQKFAL